MSLTLNLLKTNKIKLLNKLKCKNVHQIPKITKVVVSTGLNTKLVNVNLINTVITEFSLITSLKPLVIKAKQAISAFNIKQNSIIALKTTLRRARMYEFLDRLINIALPKVREFTGISAWSLDKNNNISFGIKEYSVFPEILYNKHTAQLGLNVTICMNTKTKQQSLLLLKCINLPITKEKLEKHKNARRNKQKQYKANTISKTKTKKKQSKRKSKTSSNSKK